MKCSCGTELRTDEKLIHCPKCGRSFDAELVKELYKYYFGKK